MMLGHIAILEIKLDISTYFTVYSRLNMLETDVAIYIFFGL